MNTFLTFVLDRFLVRQGSYWRCPWCERGNASIVVNPPREGCTDKWRCAGCLAWGDEGDILRFIHPDERYPQLRARLDRFRAEWESGAAAGEVPNRKAPTFSSHGEGGTEPSPPARDWETIAVEFAATLKRCKARWRLAEALGVPGGVFDQFPLTGYDAANQRYTFPECDAVGRVTGIFWRTLTGERGVLAGGNRGLTLPKGWHEHEGPTFVVEGVTDTLVMAAAGLSCVGRFSATGGAKLLADLFRDNPVRPIVIVGENDRKGDGRWPGRDGAERIAAQLSVLLSRRVAWVLPPDGFKDVRDWLTAPERAVEPWDERGGHLFDLLAR